MSHPEAPPDVVHALYSDHHGWLKQWLQRRLGNTSDAADFAQDTFIRILTAPQPARVAASIREPRTYLATIARRVMVDHFRRRTLERTYLDALAAMPETCEVSPETRVLILETLFEIDAMLDGLGQKARQAFLLSQLEGLGYAEIGERLGVSVSSVKKYVARAVERCLLLSLDLER